jgi:hypothetical protein
MQRGKKLFRVNVGCKTDIHPDFLSKIIEIKILLAENFCERAGIRTLNQWLKRKRRMRFFVLL